MIEIRKGQAPGHLARADFSVRFRASFIDPEFRFYAEQRPRTRSDAASAVPA